MQFTPFPKTVLLSAVVFLFASYALAQTSPFLPAVTRVVNASSGKAKREFGRISGLLLSRQQLECNSGFLCPGSSTCCPAGGQCCSQGNCCDTGQFCLGEGYCCYNFQQSCEDKGCCNLGENCCPDGGCCSLDTYCDKDAEGQYACCPIGATCTGTPLPSSTYNPFAPNSASGSWIMDKSLTTILRGCMLVLLTTFSLL